MLLRKASGKLPQSEGLAGKSAKGGAVGSANKGGGQPLACNVRHDHQMRSVRLRPHSEVVSTDLVAGSRTDRHGVAGDRGRGLGQEALLDSGGGMEIRGQASVVRVAFVVDGVLDGNRRL